MKTRKPKVTYRQEDGDDGYCYCVRVDGRAVTYASLTRNQAMYEKERILTKWAEENAGDSKKREQPPVAK